jgi:hypothetical protein
LLLVLEATGDSTFSPSGEIRVLQDELEAVVVPGDMA